MSRVLTWLSRTAASGELISLADEFNTRNTYIMVTILHWHILGILVRKLDVIIGAHRYLFARHLRAQRVHWQIRRQQFKGIISQTDRQWNAGRVSAAAARIPPSAVELGSSATTKFTFSPRQKPIAEIQPPLAPSPRCIHTTSHVHCAFYLHLLWS